MEDPFALLGLPRRPWLDEGAIRAAFQQRARELHPDAPGGDAAQFAALNAAQAALADPAGRLLLLAGDIAAPAMPRDAALGFRIGSALREADARIATPPRNPLDRALAAATRKSLENLHAELANKLSDTDAELRALDAAWPDIAPAQLASLGAELRFLRRWQAQLRERELALSL